jgi:uncharacterized protein (TIGR02001 family)
MLNRKFIVAGLLAAALPGAALAEDAPKAPEPPKAPYTLSANVYLVSDYFFRGITQTWGKPAIQGGFDFVHDSGIYLGTWASNVSGNEYPGGSMEWDLYGGYNYKLNDDITLGAGVLYYYYPGANFSKGTPAGADKTPNTFEGNLSASWKWLSFKFSYAFTDYFGAGTQTGFKDDTKGTYYPELNAAYPLPWVEGLSLVGHLGYTKYNEELAVANANGKTDPSYADWKLGLSYAWKDGWTVGAYYVDTTNKDYYKGALNLTNPNETKDLAHSGGYITVGRTF